MSWEERFSKTMVSPGRALIVSGKNAPNTKCSPAVEGASTPTVYVWDPLTLAAACGAGPAFVV
jgi:hypothetical protein